jgi:hypothetical protein
VAATAEPADVEKAMETVKKGMAVLASKGVYEVSEVGSIVNQLAWLVYDAEWSGIPDDGVAKIKDAAKTLLEVFMAVAEQAATELADHFKAASTTKSSVLPAQNVTKSSAEPTTGNEPSPDLGNMIAAAVEKALSQVVEAVNSVKAGVEEVRSEVTATKTSLNERVSAIESAGQTRKGAGAEEASTSTTKSEDNSQRSPAGNNILRSFGSRHAD